MDTFMKTGTLCLFLLIEMTAVTNPVHGVREGAFGRNDRPTRRPSSSDESQSEKPSMAPVYFIPLILFAFFLILLCCCYTMKKGKRPVAAAGNPMQDIRTQPFTAQTVSVHTVSSPGASPQPYTSHSIAVHTISSSVPIVPDAHRRHQSDIPTHPLFNAPPSYNAVVANNEPPPPSYEDYIQKNINKKDGSQAAQWTSSIPMSSVAFSSSRIAEDTTFEHAAFGNSRTADVDQRNRHTAGGITRAAGDTTDSDSFGNNTTLGNFITTINTDGSIIAEGQAIENSRIHDGSGHVNTGFVPAAQESGSNVRLPRHNPTMIRFRSTSSETSETNSTYL